MFLGQGGVTTNMGRGSLFFDQDTPQSVNCGQYYVPGTTYSDFFWEGWVKFTKASANGYAWIDGYGGNHYNIFGATSDTVSCTVVGKYYEGSPDYSGGEEFPLNYWTHIAHGWDGTTYMQWINGCLAFVVAEATPRLCSANASSGMFMIGGPIDHSMWEGNISQVRGFEGSGCLARGLPGGATDFAPERYFRPLRYISDTFQGCEFAMDLSSPDAIFPDLSLGFDAAIPPVDTARLLHSGALAGNATSGVASSIAYSGTFPSWVSGDIIAPTYAPTPPSTPVGAVVFDSFSRKDTTYAFYTAGDSVTGSTEAGTAGALAWSQQTWPVRDGRLAYWHNYVEINTVDAGIADVDARVTRMANDFCHTGLVLRYTDANNYVYVKGYPTQIVTGKVVAGIDTVLDSTAGVPSSYAILRADVVGTSMTVYRDATSVATVTVPSSAATRHGLYAPGQSTKNVNRFDDFTIFAG